MPSKSELAAGAGAGMGAEATPGITGAEAFALAAIFFFMLWAADVSSSGR